VHQTARRCKQEESHLHNFCYVNTGYSGNTTEEVGTAKFLCLLTDIHIGNVYTVWGILKFQRHSPRHITAVDNRRRKEGNYKYCSGTEGKFPCQESLCVAILGVTSRGCSKSLSMKANWRPSKGKAMEFERLFCVLH
jgi:hypothetical protein